MQFIDTGSGISEEDLSKVFQAYFTTKSGGHGLGMMIVDRIMRAHGGQIGIESRKGAGTVITLQFPQQHRRSRLLEGEARQIPNFALLPGENSVHLRNNHSITSHYAQFKTAPCGRILGLRFLIRCL